MKKAVCFPSIRDWQIEVPGEFQQKSFPLLKTYYKGFGNDRNRPLMHLNEYGPAESVRTYAVISRYLCGIVQHTQTPFILEYEEVV